MKTSMALMYETGGSDFWLLACCVDRVSKLDGKNGRTNVVSSSWPGLPDTRYIFKPKIKIWINFGGSCNPRSWYILWTFGIFYGHLVYFMDIWYILWTFGIFYGHLVYFMDIWYILWTFGIFCGNVVYFPPFWYVVPRKIRQPCSRPNISALKWGRWYYVMYMYSVENRTIFYVCYFYRRIIFFVAQPSRTLAIHMKGCWAGQMWPFVLCQESEHQ
jgi:hypothetical protein